MLPHQRLFGVFLAIVFALIFTLFYGGSSWISAGIPWRIYPALPFESAIPLMPAWSFVYLSMPLLLFYCIARLDWMAQWGLFVMLVVELLVACLFFLMLPVELDFPATTVEGIWKPWFILATTVSMENNHLPSLHAAFAYTAAIALQPVLSRILTVMVWLWVGLISVSTLLVHEHHLLDIVAGILLAVIVQKIVLPLTQKDDVLRRVRLEWLWWYNQWLFTKRHWRYGLIAVVIVTQRLLRPKCGTLLVSGYCFLQVVDDLMDGDRVVEKPPLQIMDGLIRAWNQGQFNLEDDDMLLAWDMHRRLHSIIDSDVAIAEVSELLQTMRRDHMRARQREIWSADKIWQQHHKTFSLSLNLLFSALSSKTRAKDVPELVAVLGWCSTMRDLREDLQVNIINIPAEILSASPSTNSYNVDMLLTNAEFTGWMQQQRQQALNLLEQLNNRLSITRLDASGNKVVRIFSRSVRQFALKRFPKLYPDLNISQKGENNLF